MIISEKIDKILNEGFSKKDLYDFYALDVARSDGYQSVDQEQRSNIERYYESTVDYIYNDLFKQLSKKVLQRNIVDTGESFSQIKSQFKKYGLEWKGHKLSIDSMSDSNIRAALAQASEIQDDIGYFTGKTWRDLAHTLSRVNATTTGQKVFWIDHLLQMAHHGGEITDYLEERAWLGDALSHRASANMNALLNNASRTVRDLVKSGTHGVASPDPSRIEVFETTLRRTKEFNRFNIQVRKIDDDTLNLKMKIPVIKHRKFYSIKPYRYGGDSQVQYVDGELNIQISDLISVSGDLDISFSITDLKSRRPTYQIISDLLLYAAQTIVAKDHNLFPRIGTVFNKM